MTIDKIFNTDFVQYSSYDNCRSIASYVDGLKNSGRKVAYFCKDLKDFKKVSILKSEISLKSQYLHNEDILSDIIVNFARDYDCSICGDLPLLEPLSAVGSRIRPSASSPRYSSVRKSKFYNLIFNTDDEKVLEQQHFEGVKIEPRFLLPTLPLILLYANNGMGVGFAQNIMPRSQNDIISAIKDILKGKEPSAIYPTFKGYKGKIELLNSEFGKRQWKFTGIYNKLNNFNLEITETTPFATNESMLVHLNKLKQDKIIKNYKDYSLGDNFKYTIQVSGEFWDKHSNIHKLLGIETTDTENFTCIDENNFVKTFENEIEILKAFIKIKLEYTQKRKDLLLNELELSREFASNKIKFITAILDKKIILDRKSKQEIVSQIQSIGITKNIETYALMPLYSLSADSINKLNKDLEAIENKKAELLSKSPKDLWIENILELRKL